MDLSLTPLRKQAQRGQGTHLRSVSKQMVGVLIKVFTDCKGHSHFLSPAVPVIFQNDYQITSLSCSKPVDGFPRTWIQIQPHSLSLALASCLKAFYPFPLPITHGQPFFRFLIHQALSTIYVLYH